ncbi:TerD family protein [Psychrobacter aestuarii]|uniref:TerD domain-containing protein n=1 Tax=Psychrobacter aestuarii TaxID=556327 RepID=A0ABN0VY88_9GAMM|nr:TerD family protein [Psychrobacter aestuarii]
MPIATDPNLVSDNLTALGMNRELLLFAMNYDADKVESKGLLKRFKQNQGMIDIDIACAMYDAQCQLQEMVWFKQLRDKAESVRHQGDSLNGKDRGEQAMYHAPFDQEQIRLYLTSVPKHIKHLALLVSSYHGQPFSGVNAGELHVGDDEGNHLIDINLKQLPKDCQSLWVASLHREIDGWYLTAQSLPLSDHALDAAAEQVAYELARTLPSV